jgi:hypothetical protein
LPTLAYFIVEQDIDYREALVTLLSSPSNVAAAKSNVMTQFRLLFGDLLPKRRDTVCSHVIAIDALDECGTPEDQGKLAECILSLV